MTVVSAVAVRVQESEFSLTMRDPEKISVTVSKLPRKMPANCHGRNTSALKLPRPRKSQQTENVSKLPRNMSANCHGRNTSALNCHGREKVSKLKMSANCHGKCQQAATEHVSKLSLSKCQHGKCQHTSTRGRRKKVHH